MQASELVELGALIAINGRAFLRGQERLSDGGINEYWAVARCRIDRWCQSLVACGRQTIARRRQHSRLWRRIPAVLEEVFTGEILTRVWTAVACEHDLRQGTSYVSPVVRSIFMGHMEARNRALGVMFHAQDYDFEEALVVNRLRALSERWTDMLLAQLVPDCDIAQVAFDEKRVYDFADDLPDHRNVLDDDQRWRLIHAALKSAFKNGVSNGSPNADLNERIASTILSCFRPEQFDSTGAFRSLWMLRLNRATTDAQEMIDELLTVE